MGNALNSTDTTCRVLFEYNFMINDGMVLCLQVDIALQLGTPFQAFHQHLMFMLDNVMPKADRRIFNSLSSTSAVVDFLRDYCGVAQSCASVRELSNVLSSVNIDSCSNVVNR